jgi:hypothetical protein
MSTNEQAELMKSNHAAPKMIAFLLLMLLMLLPFVRCSSNKVFVATVHSLTVRVRFNDSFVGIALSLGERLFLDESRVSSAAVHHNSQWLVPGQGLRLANVQQTPTSLSLHWLSEVGAALVEFATAVEVLSDGVLFRQRFERGVNASVLPGDERRLERPCTQWPSFAFAPDVAALWWSAMFDMGTFSSVPEQEFVGGAASGVPLVLFDRQSLDSIVISPATAFKSTVLGNHRGTLVAGVGGTFLSIPAGHVTETLIVGRRQSLIGAMYAWGDVLLARGGKRRTRHEQSALATLGYATDNGAVYHYHPELNQSYAQTLVQLKQWCDENDLPLRYVQLDSWWYGWNEDHGVDDWRPRTDERTFPDGALPDLGLPYQLHNRFFSRTTKMSKWYAFAESDPARSKRPMAFPRAANNNQYRLYSEWMSRARKRYRIAVYEQDWMAPQVLDMPFPLEVVGEADSWLESMGRAASENGIEIMYCMPLRADYLISTRIAAVQSVRVGRDYANWLILRLPAWQIFVTSVLADALGLMVIKDTFWSVERQPSFVAGRRADRANDHGENATETSPALMALISVLSAGQVAPGDRIGHLNVPLLLRTCDANGTLLRPDRPALPTPHFFRRVPSADEMTSDVVVYAPAMHSVQLLAINLTREHAISLADMNVTNSARLLASVVGTTGGDWHIDAKFAVVDEQHPLITPAQRQPISEFALNFDYWLLSQSLGTCSGIEWFFLGERATKFVAVSRDRFRRVSLDETACRLTADVHIGQNEQVVIQVAHLQRASGSVRVVERTMSGNDPQFERRFGEQWIEVQVSM